MARTRHADCSGPGLSRVRRGRGFSYVGPDGIAAVTDAATLDRIRALAIPPAWEDVWISPDPQGHLQATGVDRAGRKQYRYHADWLRRRDQAKFDAMVAFAQALPSLRRRVAGDLGGSSGLDEARVLACAVRLLDVGFFRIGSEDYAARYETYGLTTLLKRHVRVEHGGVLVFDYPAKDSLRRIQRVSDPAVLEVVGPLRRRRGGGPELLAFRRRGRWVDVRAEHVNAYLKDVTSGDFSAKDFRTWNATALAAVALAARAGDVTSRTSRRRVVAAAIAEVARYLGNTPAVSRRSYVDPRVIDRFEAGVTIADALALAIEHELPVGDGGPTGPATPVDEAPVDERVRRAVLDLIADDESAADVERVPGLAAA